MSPPIKMKLRSRGIIPNGGGFFVTDQLTGIKLAATTFDQLVQKVRDSRIANGYPIGLDLENEVENWCCISHPNDAEVFDERLPRRRALNLDNVMRGTQVLATFKLAGSPLVDQAEANRRAAICARCPLNVFWSQSCSICGKVESVVMSIVGNVRTPNDQQLYSCSICSCSLKAAVHLPNEILNKANTAEMNQAFEVAAEAFSCWHRPDGLDEKE